MKGLRGELNVIYIITYGVLRVKRSIRASNRLHVPEEFGTGLLDHRKSVRYRRTASLRHYCGNPLNVPLHLFVIYHIMSWFVCEMAQWAMLGIPRGE